MQEEKRSENKETAHNELRNGEGAKPTETMHEYQKPTRAQGDNKERRVEAEREAEKEEEERERERGRKTNNE